MKRLWLLLVLVVCGCFPSLAAQAAGGVSYEVSSTYQLNDKSVAVTQTVKLSSTGSLGEQIIRVPGRSDSFKITENNKTVEADQTKETEGKVRSIPFAATDLVLELGSRKSTTIKVSYKTADLYNNFVQAESLLVPPLNLKGTISKQSITISAPLDLEIGSIFGPEPTDSSSAEDRQIYEFSKDGAITDAISLQLGSNTVASVTVKSTLENDSFWWQKKSIVLPLDTNQQRSFIRSIEPQPSKVRVDRDGNIIADYNLFPRQTINVTAKAQVFVEQKTYDLENTSGFQQLNVNLIGDYTANTSLWPKGVAGQLDISKNELREKSVLSAIRQVYDTVIEKSDDFKETADFNQRIGSETDYATSLDYADQLVAALRAVGVPARIVGGVITDNNLTVYKTPHKHAWVEAEVPNIGWITLDPTLGRLNSKSFGTATMQRVALFIWGVSDHIPAFQDSSINVRYTSASLPEDSLKKADIVSGTNYMLVPGVSLLMTKVSMPQGIIHDDVSVRVAGSGEARLGSLAPLQKTASSRLLLGATSWQPASLQLVINGAAVSKGQAAVNYFAMAAVIILLIILVWVMVKLHKKRRAPIVLEDDDSSNDIHIEGEDLLNVQRRSETPSPSRSVDPFRRDGPPPGP